MNIYESQYKEMHNEDLQYGEHVRNHSKKIIKVKRAKNHDNFTRYTLEELQDLQEEDALYY